jgi:hypothetical protein
VDKPDGEEICCVCGDVLGANNFATCRVCGGKFHFAWSVDAPVENCGQCLFDNVACGIIFVCNLCGSTEC